MSTLIDTDDLRAIDVRIEMDKFYVTLNDDRVIGVPYSWYWCLAKANLNQRENWRIISGGFGIHWEAINEDISIQGILNGNKDACQSPE